MSLSFIEIPIEPSKMMLFGSIRGIDVLKSNCAYPFIKMN